MGETLCVTRMFQALAPPARIIPAEVTLRRHQLLLVTLHPQFFEGAKYTVMMRSAIS